MKTGTCELCKRDDVPLTKHHLIPKQKGGDDTALVCIPCSKQIHALFANRELKQQYNTIEKLQANAQVQTWIDWVRKHNPVDIRYHGKGGFHK